MGLALSGSLNVEVTGLIIEIIKPLTIPRQETTPSSMACRY